MGSLMEIARGVMEEQDRRAGVETAFLTQKRNPDEISVLVGPLASDDPELSNDINDVNDQSPPASEVAVDVDTCHFSVRAEDLEQFACSGQIVLIYLEAIGEAILIVADNVPPPDGLFSRGYLVYTASEWKALIGVTPKHFRFLHSLKKMFGGEIELEEEESHT